MPFSDQYRRQVTLLIRVIPLVAQESCFALKGGTAINLFVRDLPRLSVDIDLTYLPVQPRDQSLKQIEAALRRIADRIRAQIAGCQVTEGAAEGRVNKLFVQLGTATVKIEVTPVLRGSVYPAQTRTVTQTVEDEFGFAEIQVVSHSDLYAGKLVAALDRQHPRDFFDVRHLLANEGITDDLRKAFIVYMLSHHRPMAEVLDPPRLDMTEDYEHGFVGMTDEPVPLAELESTREEMIETIVGGMPAAHKDFLIGFERGEPDWDLLGLPGVPDLPAVKWRQINLDKLPKEKRDALVAGLKKALGV
ncbi:nucleotidyl transferase AbiEii/AbiGii toxin family protein [Pseudolabrys taiwanensis]|uniref:Nucleotidyl transferase AbiEii/AbiGii toxin family protein n=1 Tax=Pseudolabrys taiwanensis TaxID=331696 RepID=A0A345ZX99_9HYPH|nr:nucleotidyl transferase AbiEii/AbiGii toxin family protein [Pseudolabrys taiwanensis]AXK81546.1 nucleotidyl transferase AbiEii/AbiGii toxin family protein [Pseudolabrys taiwanensis]